MMACMVSRFLIALAVFLLPTQAFSQDLEGHWAFRIDDATIFVFALEQADSGEWEGEWRRPETIDSNGAVFRNMGGSQIVTPAETRQRGDVVQFTFDGPEGSDRDDILRFTLVDESRANLTYVGIPGDPYPLVRVHRDTALGPFEEGRIYDRDQAVTEADLEELARASEDIQPAEEPEDQDDSEKDENPRIDADFLDGL